MKIGPAPLKELTQVSQVAEWNKEKENRVV